MNDFIIKPAHHLQPGDIYRPVDKRDSGLLGEVKVSFKKVKRVECYQDKFFIEHDTHLTIYHVEHDTLQAIPRYEPVQVYA